jgi:hypothetical protein
MWRSITGGQNSALSLLCLCAVVAGRASGRPWLAGAGLSVLFFKPQFAMPLAVLLVLDRQHRAVAIAAGAVAVGYLAGAIGVGWDWPLEWWNAAVTGFEPGSRRLNASFAVSIWSVAHVVGGHGSLVAHVVGLVIPAAIGAWLARIFVRQDLDPTARLAIASAALVVTSPHALWYDLGLLALPLLVVADRLGARAAPFVAAVLACGVLERAPTLAGVHLYFPLALVVLAGTARMLAATRLPRVAGQPAREGVTSPTPSGYRRG